MTLFETKLENTRAELELAILSGNEAREPGADEPDEVGA